MTPTEDTDMNYYEWAVLDADGSVLDRLATAEDARVSLTEGGWPEGATVAFVSDPSR